MLDIAACYRGNADFSLHQQHANNLLHLQNACTHIFDFSTSGTSAYRSACEQCLSCFAAQTRLVQSGLCPLCAVTLSPNVAIYTCMQAPFTSKKIWWMLPSACGVPTSLSQLQHKSRSPSRLTKTRLCSSWHFTDFRHDCKHRP